MADVESLELQITSDAKDAKDSLDALIDTLNQLKQVTSGGAGLGNVTKDLGKIKNVNIGLSGDSKTGKSFTKMLSSAAKKITSLAVIGKSLETVKL